ncbi:Predicted transcriptional regulator, ArsR family [Halorientalis persicus]|uniref:Predicted transcriptional regulator, ArsR family n=1 Tax=Halorientalis persicus TaxID=1367881 RepID=A0A1H8L5V7_9EURY|nr:transcriptional regulator [Halorientalis persicus]SEO00580.1 Predicted transcriptional regulator, ArsR family [Halorientalis persicus]
MTDSPDPESFADINEKVGEEWEAQTTPYERVREVINRAYSPISAEAVADDARTSPKTARKHLEALADEGFVTTSTSETGGKRYQRSSESLVVEQAAEILAEISTDELRERVADMRETVREYQNEFGVESPEELSVTQTNEVLAETGTGSETIDEDTLQEWQTTRRNLAFANAALSIANAQKFVTDDTHTSSGSISPS